MNAAATGEDIRQMAEQLFSQQPDWITFYREVLGLRGIVRQCYPTRDALAAFEQTDSYQAILDMLAQLRNQTPAAAEEAEPTRVITIRLPKSMHESLRSEAFERQTSMNKLCISKLLQYIDGDQVPTDL